MHKYAITFDYDRKVVGLGLPARADFDPSLFVNSKSDGFQRWLDAVSSPTPMNPAAADKFKWTDTLLQGDFIPKRDRSDDPGAPNTRNHLRGDYMDLNLALPAWVYRAQKTPPVAPGVGLYEFQPSFLPYTKKAGPLTLQQVSEFSTPTTAPTSGPTVKPRATISQQLLDVATQSSSSDDDDNDDNDDNDD